MSTSLLYHAFGLRGYDYVHTDYQKGGVVFTIRQRPRTCRCPVCNSLGLFWAADTRSGSSKPCPSAASLSR